jgi:type VI secretion system secreted protein Hcp
MSECVYISLKINGSAVRGDSSIISMGRENTIEATYFDYNVSAGSANATGGQATARRAYQPIVIRKRIDRSTPLLWRALCLNQVVEALCKFYRPMPTGDGTFEQFYTIEIEGGRVVDHRIISSDNFTDPNTPAIEEIKISFTTITQTFNNGGIEHSDTWSVSR